MIFLASMFTSLWNFVFSNQIAQFCLIIAGLLLCVYVFLKLVKKVWVFIAKKCPSLGIALIIMSIVAGITYGSICLCNLVASEFSKGDYVMIKKRTWDEAFRLDKVELHHCAGDIGIVRFVSQKTNISVEVYHYVEEDNEITLVRFKGINDKDLIKLSEEEFNKKDKEQRLLLLNKKSKKK